MKKIRLLKDVGPYKAGQTISIDDKGAAQLVRSKRGEPAEKPAKGD